MQPRYNLALLPVEEEIREAFFSSAKLFKQHADGYCLQPGKALPHITLSQFRAENDERAKEIVTDLLGEDVVVNLVGAYLHGGQDEHTGRYWIGYTVVRDGILMRFQETVVDVLSIGGAEVISFMSDGYFPHFTVARLGDLPATINTGFYDNSLIMRDIPCHTCLGASDENGQFLKMLAP